MEKCTQLIDSLSGICGLKLKCDQMAEVKRCKTPSVKGYEQLEFSHKSSQVQTGSTNTWENHLPTSPKTEHMHLL